MVRERMALIQDVQTARVVAGRDRPDARRACAGACVI
jgi:hypothetical protein